MKNTTNFTEGPILGPMIRFALPVLFALFLQSLYGAVDLLIVGKFATSADVSAVSTGSQIMLTITGVISAFAMGLTILVGRKIGEQRPQEAGDVIGSGILFFLILAVVSSLLMVIFGSNFASMMKAPAEAYSRTVSYIRICGGGSVIIIAYNLIGAIFRGLGDSKTPFITVAISAVCNMILDYIFVSMFAMGTSGAAVATVISQFVSVVLSLLLIKRQALPFSFHKEQIRWNQPIISNIIKFGLPLSLSNFLVGVSFLVMTAIINRLGLTASAAIGVGGKVTGFIMLIPSSFMQALSAIVSQNMGAGKKDRAIKTLKYGITVSLVTGVVMFLFAWLKGDLLAEIFSNDPEVVVQAAQYLKAYAVDCLFTAILFCMIGFFNGVGMTKFVMIQDILGAFLIRIPVAFFMSNLEPVSLFKIGLATPCSTLLQSIACIIALYFFAKHSSMPKENVQ